MLTERPTATEIFGLAPARVAYYAGRMAWGLRRSSKFGPLRINASKSGLGYSLGIPGLRMGKDARGRRYSSMSIPGTGLYSRTYTSSRTRGRSSASISVFAIAALSIYKLVRSVLRLV